METKEHTELGDALRLAHWSELKGNPYIKFNDKGVMSLNLQAIGDNGLPEDTQLLVTSGMVMAMSGDYFGGKEIDLELPTRFEFTQAHKNDENNDEYESLASFLIHAPIPASQEQKLIRSYRKFANPKVTNKEIDTIYKIDSARYIPFSETLNSYVQQVMFALRVKNYGNILSSNLSHFTPWSVRTYIIGHHLALQFAHISFELSQLIKDTNYESNNEEFNILRAILRQNRQLTSSRIQEYIYRYQALSLGMELFCFHYYSDHFAAGHSSLMGDLRALLPKQFGALGGILVNSLHNELNEVTIYTSRPYCATKSMEQPIATAGDGSFNSAKNSSNKLACIAGMHDSLADVQKALQGHPLPEPPLYGGLSKLPDVDFNYRQPQPLLLIGDDYKIYYRKELSKIRTLSPLNFKTMRASPSEHGYKELKGLFNALILVSKLRLFPYFYKGKTQPITPAELLQMKAEETQLNPGKRSLFTAPIEANSAPSKPDWRTPVDSSLRVDGIKRNSMFNSSSTFEPENETPVSEGLSLGSSF